MATDDADTAAGPQLADLDLLGFLGVLEESLDRRIRLVAVGGTALTLLKVKPSTRDVDFTGPRADILAFREAARQTPHGFKVDTWFDGSVFALALPADYLERATLHPTRLARIELRTLHPVDLVVSKVGRFDPRDRKDIADAVRRLGIAPEAVEARAGQVGLAGNEANFTHHLALLLNGMRERPPFQGDQWRGR